jgi:hypothetical protein
MINCGHRLDKKRPSFISAAASAGSNTAAHRSRHRHAPTGGDGRPAPTHAAASRRGRAGLRSEGNRDIEAMGAEREDEAKP